jgi:hypothetical protein
MTAGDVALWDISVMNQRLLTSASYQAMCSVGKTPDSVSKTPDGRSTNWDQQFAHPQHRVVDG